jgi:hypothetical protein
VVVHTAAERLAAARAGTADDMAPGGSEQPVQPGNWAAVGFQLPSDSHSRIAGFVAAVDAEGSRLVRTRFPALDSWHSGCPLCWRPARMAIAVAYFGCDLFCPT